MKKYEEKVKELENKLEILESVLEDILKIAEEGIKITKKILIEIRNTVIRKEFDSKLDEIQFFKKYKPQIYSKVIYYVTLFNIESKRPRSSNKSIVKYLNNHIDKLQTYFNENLEFYQYIRRGATFLDEQYFLRGKANIRLYPDTFHFLMDEQFSTSHDCSVATIFAYDMLITHLKKEVDKVEDNGMKTNYGAFKNQSKLFWTGNKTDLIELIYALHSSGSINSGTADIKELASVCEQMFNIELGDYYRTFLEIKSRKINQTKFIDKIRESLLNKMIESDE